MKKTVRNFIFFIIGVILGWGTVIALRILYAKNVI